MMYNTVRRNLTLDIYTAETLENLSNVMGVSQGEILKIALAQPMMRRLYSFVYACREQAVDKNPLVALMETYQCAVGHMTPRVGESIIRATKEWFEDYAVIKDRNMLAEEVPTVNSYISGHMTKGSRQADPYFDTVYQEAENNSFITPDMKADEIKGKVVKYMDIMLANPDDKRLMGESYLFRNLLIILTDCFRAPTMKECKDLFATLSDGYVLPFRESVS